MAVETDNPQGSAEAEKDPRFARARARGAGDQGREMIEHVLQGAELSEEEEADALEFLLGAPAPIPYEMVVTVDTPRGPAPLTFVFLAPTGRKLDEIEERHRSQTTGMIDRLSADLELVATATLFVENHRGRQIDLKSAEFRTVQQRKPEGDGFEPLLLASGSDALERRFSRQAGLIQGVSREIRRVGGWDPERQGHAQRRLTRAALD